MRIALNGFGRIGKNFLRVLLKQETELELVAINVGPADPESLVYAIRYDSILGPYHGPISYENNCLTIGHYSVHVFSETDARKLPWKKLNIDWVVDATGHYTHREKAEEHKEAGARCVLITAPAEGDDVTIIMGVNEQTYDPHEHTIVSLGSCTTNAVIPMIAIVHDAYKISTASLTTTHAYTNSQSLVDSMGKGSGLRRTRAAALNIIPSTTGALDLAVRLIPDLKGAVIGCALRVPVAVVSIIDLVLVVQQSITELRLHELLCAAQQKMRGIVAVTDDPVVSSDFQGSTASVIIDLGLTTTCGNMIKMMGWYDNEYAYSTRIKDFLLYARHRE